VSDVVSHVNKRCQTHTAKRGDGPDSSSMTPFYNPGDRVLTKVDGVEVEATVLKVTIDIEVKIPDGTTRWRSSTKLKPVVAQRILVTAADLAHATPIEAPEPVANKPAELGETASSVEVQATKEVAFAPVAESSPTDSTVQAAPASTEEVSAEKATKQRKKKR
jgi:hypothetical protein